TEFYEVWLGDTSRLITCHEGFALLWIRGAIDLPSPLQRGITIEFSKPHGWPGSASHVSPHALQRYSATPAKTLYPVQGALLHGQTPLRGVHPARGRYRRAPT